MKKCLKCGVEYEDKDTFCPVCGEKLVSLNVCKNCGQPVDAKDTFCRHCGHKIEKEYKCEKCGATVNPDSKFCPECGAKIDKPVVSVAASETKNETKTISLSPKKVLFMLFNSVMLILLVLMFVGCFGDILVTRVTLSSSSISDSKLSIEYFFGKAIKDIQENAQHYQYPEYTNYSIFLLILEYFCWIAAIASIVLGFVVSAVNCYRGFINKDYSFKGKFYVLAFTTALPYLLLFSVLNETNITMTSSSLYSGSSLTTSMTAKTVYGWGTTMILVSVIIGMSLLAIQKIVNAYFEKKSLIRETICSILKLTFFIVFIFSFGNIIGIDYSESGSVAKGYATVHQIFANELSSYSMNSIKSVPNGATNCMIATFLLFVAALFGVILLESLFNAESRFVMYVISFLMLAMMLTGYILAYNGVLDYLAESSADSYSGIAKDAFKYSAMGIVTPIIIVLSVVGIDVTRNLGNKQLIA